MGSPYAQDRSGGGGGSPYAVDHSAGGGGSAYARPRPTSSSTAAPAAKGGGGFFHAIGSGAHWVAQKAELGAHDLKAIPGGTVHALNAGVVKPWSEALTTGHVSKQTSAGIDKLIQDTAASTAASIEHPLRDPFQTALLLAPAAHAVGSGIARTGAATGAVRAGEGARGALKAVATRPEMPPRLIRVGDEQVPLTASKNPAMRGFQALHDKAIQHAIEHNPEGRIASYGTKRVGASIGETSRYRQRMQAAPANVLAAQGAKLGHVHGPFKGGTVPQMALRLVSENSTAEEAAAFHRAQAAKGVNPKQNMKQAELADQIAKHGVLTKDARGNVVVDAARFPKLAAVDVKMAAGQAEVDKILVDKGEMTQAGLTSRINAPGRIRAGATYEAPTPGKAGVSPALDAAIAERDRLAGLHEKALTQEEKWHAEQKTKDLGPLTEADARARLSQLDAQHNAMAAKIVPEISRYGSEAGRREQLSRNTRNAQPRAVRKGTVKAEELAAASDKLHEIASKGSSPAARALADLLNERARLRDALNARAEASLAGAEPPGMPRGAAPAHVSVPPASNPYRNRIVQIGTRLEAVQQKADRLEAAAQNRMQPTGIVGGESARPGRGYVSSKLQEPKAPRSPAAGATGAVIGKVKSFITKKPYTGAALQQGLIPNNTTGLVARNMKAAYRYVNTDEYRQQAVRAGSDVRRSSRDVLVRDPALEAGKITPEIDAILGRKNLTTDEQLGHEAAFTAHMQQMIPGLRDKFAQDKSQGIGTQAPAGYRWVDKNILGDLAKMPPGPRGMIARSADNVNAAVTAATVYFKLGHVGTRAFTDASTNIIQGSANPLQLRHGVELWRKLSPEDRTRALGATGQHGFQAMPHEGASAVSMVAGAGARWWAKHVDAPFRFNSIAFEARKAGFKTPDQFRYFLDKLQHPEGLSPAEFAKIDGVARRANHAGIAYDRLNSLERNYINRGIWFYPWIKGATMFAGHTLVEHPYKAAALGTAGVQGREKQQADFGNLPSYEGGLFKVGGSAGSPLVTDFSTFSPFATPSNLLDVGAGMKHPAEFFNPALAGAGSLAYGLGQHGRPSTQPLFDSLRTAVAPAWPIQVAEAFAQRHKDQSQRMFPKSPALWGTLTPLERALGGSAVPRRLNVTAGNKAAAREKTGR